MQGNITDWGKEVKKGLIEHGWSINDLAERIGKSRTRVSGVVNGRIYSDSIASAISDLLNIEKASASMKDATRDWCMDARKAMIDLDMNTGELAEKTGYSTQYLNAIICSMLPRDYEITEKSKVQIISIKAAEAQYYRQLWWFKEVKDLLDDGKVNGSQN